MANAAAYVRSALNLASGFENDTCATLGLAAIRVVRRTAATDGVHAFRGFAAATGANAPSRGIIEIREYTIKPEAMGAYINLTAEYADVRKELLPFLGMFTCDLGGPLNRLTHLYSYKDFDERDRVRATAYHDTRWAEFISKGRPHVTHQTARVMLEAAPVYEALQLPPTGQYRSPAKPSAAEAPKVVYEMRTYQLHPGYGSVPKLVEAFSKGLPAKVAADHERGQLAFFGYTDVGMLNTVTELWRYPSAQACIRARQAARQVHAWRETIGAVTPGVQHFTSEFLYPTSFSPWQ